MCVLSTTVHIVQEIVELIRLIREAMVIIKYVMHLLLKFGFMGDPNELVVVRKQRHRNLPCSQVDDG